MSFPTPGHLGHSADLLLGLDPWGPLEMDCPWQTRIRPEPPSEYLRQYICCRIRLLHDMNSEEQMLSLGKKAANGRTLLTLLYRQPYVTANEVAAHLEVTHQTAMSLIRDFMHFGILEETTGHKRNRRFLYREYFDLFVSG